MLKIGDKVKIEFDNIYDTGELDSGTTGKKYSHYIFDNPDKVYTIVAIDDDVAHPFVLDDEYLNTTSFDESELTKVG